MKSRGRVQNDISAEAIGLVADFAPMRGLHDDLLESAESSDERSFDALRILVNVEALLELHQFVRQSVGVKPGMLDLRLLRTIQTTAAAP